MTLSCGNSLERSRSFRKTWCCAHSHVGCPGHWEKVVHVVHTYDPWQPEFSYTWKNGDSDHRDLALDSTRFIRMGFVEILQIFVCFNQ